MRTGNLKLTEIKTVTLKVHSTFHKSIYILTLSIYLRILQKQASKMYEDKLSFLYKIQVKETSTCTKSGATALLMQHGTKRKDPDNLQNLCPRSDTVSMLQWADFLQSRLRTPHKAPYRYKETTQ